MDEPREEASARLDALAKTTRQYAATAYSLFGLALVPAGLGLLLSALAYALGHPLLGAALAAFAPALLPLAAAFTQPRYQRHGRVAESGASDGIAHPTLLEVVAWAGWPLMLLWAVVVLLGATGLEGTEPGGLVRTTRLLAGAGFLATLAILAWRRPRRGDASWVVIPVLGGKLTSQLQLHATTYRLASDPTGPILEGFRASASPLFDLVSNGLLALVLGIGMHLWYRRLEARLTGLRAAEASSPEAAP